MSRAECSRYPHQGTRGLKRRRTGRCRLAGRDHEENAVLGAPRTCTRSLGGISGHPRSPHTSSEAIFTRVTVWAPMRTGRGGGVVPQLGLLCGLPPLWGCGVVSGARARRSFAPSDLTKKDSGHCVVAAPISMSRCGSQTGVVVSRSLPFAACVPVPGVRGRGRRASGDARRGNNG